MFRPNWKAAVLAASALCLLSTGAASAMAAPAGSAPWRTVGPGWSVVQYLKASPNKPGEELFYLASPTGKKYLFYSLKATPEAGEDLVDWSGDGQRVLLNSQLSHASPDKIEQVSLVTGKVITRFTWPGNISPVGYTKPDGLNILGISFAGKNWQLLRYNLRGKLQKVLASGKSAYPNPLYARNGAFLVAGTTSGLEEISNLGGVIAHFKVPDKVEFCGPQRWWNQDSVLAVCYSHGLKPSRDRLWLLNVETRRWQRFSTPSKTELESNAWQIKSGIYMQDDYTCGVIGQQWRNGSTHVIKVAGNDSAYIVTGIGSRLLVRTEQKCGKASPSSLVWFNPATKSVSYLIRPKGNTVGVVFAQAFGEQP